MAKDRARDTEPPKQSSKSTKSGKSSKTANSQLSQEYIIDSDDEHAGQATQQSAKHTKPVTDTKKNSGKLKEPKKAIPVAKEASSASDSSSSSEEESGSDDDDSSSAESEVAPAKPKETGLASSKSIAKVNGVKRKTEVQSSTDSASATGSSSSNSEEEEPDREHERKRTKTSDKPQSVDQSTTPASPTPLAALPAPKYKPPPGYHLLRHDPKSSSLRPEQLDGKQIWYITAPRNLSLSALTDFALSDIQSQKPVFSHHETNYILREDPTDNKFPSLFLPSKDGYTTAPVKISKTLRVQQHVVLPNLTSRQASQKTGSEAAGDIARASVNSIRPQPKGLRMRFKPAGFGPGRPGRIGSSSEDEGASDEDDDAREPTTRGGAVQFPKTLGAHGVREGPVDTDVSRKKVKKEKKKDKAPDATTNGEPDSISKKNKKKLDKNDDMTHEKGTASTVAHTPVQKVVAPDVEMADGSEPILKDDASSHKRSKEEKARRKEEKRLKKEKRAAKAGHEE